VIDFDYEITLLTVRALGKSGEIETHFCAPIRPRAVKGDYVESWQPQRCPLLRWRGRRKSPLPSPATSADAAVRVELFVKGDTVWFSEVSPRRTTPAW